MAAMHVAGRRNEGSLGFLRQWNCHRANNIASHCKGTSGRYSVLSSSYCYLCWDVLMNLCLTDKQNRQLLQAVVLQARGEVFESQ